jgi:hypothetical protein
MVSDFNEHWYLGLFWSEELIGNDENCIQSHFYFQNSRQQNRQNFHSQFNDFVVGNFENGGLVKMILNASFIITNEFLTSKYS